MLVINTIYMTIFGAFMALIDNQSTFLVPFGIYMESYVMTLIFYGLIFQRTVDIPLR